VHVLTRSAVARELACTLGVASVGGAADPPPEPLDPAILLAPVGELVPVALAASRARPRRPRPRVRARRPPVCRRTPAGHPVRCTGHVDDPPPTPPDGSRSCRSGWDSLPVTSRCRGGGRRGERQ